MMAFEALPDSCVHDLRTTLLDSPQEFRKEWLGEGPKSVVPFEPPLAMSDDFAARLCQALRTLGLADAWGFSAESWPGIQPQEGVVVPLDPASVRRWHDEFLPFDMVLTTPDCCCAVLFGQDEFGLAAGPNEFVETALGLSVEEARSAFATYAMEMASAARHLPAVARRYTADGQDPPR
jgi:hypothetical protein